MFSRYDCGGRWRCTTFSLNRKTTSHYLIDIDPNNAKLISSHSEGWSQGPKGFCRTWWPAPSGPCGPRASGSSWPWSQPGRPQWWPSGTWRRGGCASSTPLPVEKTQQRDFSLFVGHILSIYFSIMSLTAHPLFTEWIKKKRLGATCVFIRWHHDQMGEHVWCNLPNTATVNISQ